jgi:acyl-CoA thioesterase-1
MSRFIALVASLVMLSANAAALAAGPVLVFGDSLSAGYGLRSAEAWPVLLQARLREQGLPHAVVNASVSGETTAGGRTRLPAALEKHRPAVVILALGANDGLRGLPVGSMRANLGAMIEAARAAGAKVLLAGMEMPPNYGPDYTRKFRDAYAALAREERIAFVPFLLDGFGAERKFFQADAIHPTAAAQPLILDNLWPSLKPLLATQRAAR